MDSISDLNLDFYEKISPEKFHYFSEVIGMNVGNDIEIVFPIIKEAQHIIELGSGYGRVIEHLLKKGFQGKITAVERSNAYCKLLSDTFRDTISISQQDIKHLQFDFKVDAILWMWSGITELNPTEAQKAVKKCYDTLKPNGILFVEAPYHTLHYVGQLGEQKIVKVETEFGTLKAYMTDENEVQEFAEKSGFSKFELRTYKTGKDVERVVYILKK